MNAQIKELRIGNYIHQRDVDIYMDHYTYDGQLTEICIDADSFKEILEEYDEYDELPSYIGIPISEEWLERFGFKLSEYRDSNWFHYDHDLLTDFIYDLNNKCFRSYYEGLQASKICEVIHDLQNCFYFLTGTELTYAQKL